MEDNICSAICKDLPQVTEEQHENGATTPLLVKKNSSTWWSRCVLRYKTTRKCVNSKSALLILFWSFIVGLWNGVMLNPDLYLRNFTIIYTLTVYGLVAFVFCFFPLAGFLADVKYGRYKMVVRSLCLLLIRVFLLVVNVGGVGVSVSILDFVPALPLYFGTIGGMVLIASYIGLVGFTANVVQFGSSMTVQGKIEPSSYTGMCGSTLSP